MTDKDYHYVFIFSTIYIGEFLHFSEKKFNDIFRKNDNETDTHYPLLHCKYIPLNQNHDDPGIRFYNDLVTCRYAIDALKGIFYEFKFIGK